MIAVSRPPKIVLYKFSANIRCCLFITSLSPRVHVPESHVPKSHVPEFHVPEFHVPEFHVPEFHVSGSHVSESHVSESLSPTSSFLTLSPHVPVSFLVTASIFVVVWSFGGAGSFPYAVVFLIFGFPFFHLQNELLNRKSLPLVKKQPLPISRGVQHYLHFSVFL